MTDFSDQEAGEVDVVLELELADPAAADLLRAAFPEAEVYESAAFTGLNKVTVIVSAAGQVLRRLVAFFAAHRESYRGATLKVGPEEVSITGYTSEELQGLLDSGAVHKLLREMKR